MNNNSNRNKRNNKGNNDKEIKEIIKEKFNIINKKCGFSFSFSFRFSLFIFKLEIIHPLTYPFSLTFE